MADDIAAASTARARAAGDSGAAAFDARVKAIEALLKSQRYDEARRELARLRDDYPQRIDSLAPDLRALLPPR